MTNKEYFDECLRNKGYQTVDHLQYKVINKVLYFQCSHGLEDWKANFDAFVVPYKKMSNIFYVHKGFLLMWKQVRDIVSTMEFDTIVGYSQGAVFASLAYEDTLFNRNIECKCITFGCPRFLYRPNQIIRSRFSGIVRIKNPFDVVTLLPLYLMGYRHVGKHIILTNVAKKPKGISLISWLSGHHPDMYRQNLEGI